MAGDNPMKEFTIKLGKFLAEKVESHSGVGQLILNFDRPSDHRDRRPRVLLIGPGLMRVPPNGWGAVELVIHQHHQELIKIGYLVDVLNSKKLSHWIHAFWKRPRLVINHYDLWARRAWVFSSISRSKLVSLTHYAYADKPSLWDSAYRKCAKYLAKSNALIALNEKIRTSYLNMFPHLSVYIIPNYVEVADFRIQPSGIGAICLGKVEPRKKQIELALSLPEDFPIVFVGPVVDNRFELLSPKLQAKFIPGWNRAQVENNLTKYSTLVLLSDAEADALVLHEAQAAGLSLVVAESALGSQDPLRPWVSVVSEPSGRGVDTLLTKTLEQSIAKNNELRTQIREYAENTLDYENFSKGWSSVLNAQKNAKL
jgi:hypothetical protein